MTTNTAAPPQGLTTRVADAADVPAIAQLHARCFGPGRFTRTAYRIREASPGLALYGRVAWLEGEIVAAIQFTPITTGGIAGALLLGPLAVLPEYAGRGIGARLITEGLRDARDDNYGYVLLVGDTSYYARHGFAPVAPGLLTLPGPVAPHRLLACELIPGASDRHQGLVMADNEPAAT